MFIFNKNYLLVFWLLIFFTYFDYRNNEIFASNESPSNGKISISQTKSSSLKKEITALEDTNYQRANDNLIMNKANEKIDTGKLPNPKFTQSLKKSDKNSNNKNEDKSKILMSDIENANNASCTYVCPECGFSADKPAFCPYCNIPLIEAKYDQPDIEEALEDEIDVELENSEAVE